MNQAEGTPYYLMFSVCVKEICFVAFVDRPQETLRASFLLKSRKVCVINYSKGLTGQGCHWHIHTQ